MGVIERIRRSTSGLTPSERRVAEVLVAQLQLVAFGTVAELAGQARVGVATVARLAAKLDFDGFSALQSAIQLELAQQLRPAAERIRRASTTLHNRVEHHRRLEVENVQVSLETLENEQVSEYARRIARGSRVWLASGDASIGVVTQFGNDLATLRSEIAQINGNDVAVQRQIALIEPNDVVIAIDVRRYDRWLLEAVALILERRPWMLVITDRVMSPLAERADAAAVVAAGGGGPFDSHVGMLAVFNVIVAAVADELRADAAPRLERTEAAWRRARSLLAD